MFRHQCSIFQCTEPLGLVTLQSTRKHASGDQSQQLDRALHCNENNMSGRLDGVMMYRNCPDFGSQCNMDETNSRF